MTPSSNRSTLHFGNLFDPATPYKYSDSGFSLAAYIQATLRIHIHPILHPVAHLVCDTHNAPQLQISKKRLVNKKIYRF